MEGIEVLGRRAMALVRVREGIVQALKPKPLHLANFGPVLPVRSAWGKAF